MQNEMIHDFKPKSCRYRIIPELFNSPEYSIFPGFCDVHVHFREPGFSYKETIATGSQAAAAGGYTAVCTMPNLNPVPDNAEHLKAQTDIIAQNSCISTFPYGAITTGEKGESLSAMEEMAPNVIAFSDDGKGVQNREMMRRAMETARDLGKLIVAHCEVNDLLRDGYIHDGNYAKAHGHRGICSESEWRQIERDLELSAATGCAYHVCHISTKESVELIRQAKKSGVNVTCETAPHYLLLDETMLQEDGKWKMNPPLRAPEDREALLEGLKDGTIDIIATDHAPHSAEEKSRGLEKSAFGIIGIEIAFPLLYSGLVRTGLIPLEIILAALTENPRRRFNIPENDDYCVWDLNEKYTIAPEKFISMGHATPFEGREVYGKCKMTVHNGVPVWTDHTEAA